jgi:hypothetical protein
MDDAKIMAVQQGFTRRRGENKCVGAIHELPAIFHHADTFGRFVNRPYGMPLSFFDII